MRVRTLEKAPISQVGCNRWFGGIRFLTLPFTIQDMHPKTFIGTILGDAFL